ncbi:MAG: hypothetical protein KF864_01590 [Phycisphaeraceae bacterium]|nr:hypothetical protein [Phycisphaeraceae bacterium]
MGVPIAAIVLVALLTLVGMLLVWAGVRGRRVSHLPACARCAFDLSGLWPLSGDKAVCPECGSLLTAPRAVRHVQRARRWVLLVMGVLLLIGPLVITVVAVSGWVVSPAGARYWPGFALRAAMGSMPDLAAPELARRVKDGDLSGSAASAAAERVLGLQASPGFAWRPGVGDLFEMIDAQGLVTPEQARRYVENAGTPTLEWRARIEAMKPLPVNIAMGPLRVGSTRGIRIVIDDVQAVADDGRVWRSSGKLISRVGAVSRSAWPVLIPVEFEEGSHPVTLRARVKLSIDDGTSAEAVGFVDARAVAVVWVLPRGVLSVAMRPDETLAPAIRGAMSVRDMKLEVFAGDLWLNGMVVLENAPMGCSFEIFARQGQEDGSVREWRVGEMTGRAFGGSLWNGIHSKVPGMRPGVVDIVLRSSPEPAQKGVEVLEAWQGELVFEGVEVVGGFPPP